MPQRERKPKEDDPIIDSYTIQNWDESLSSYIDTSSVPGPVLTSNHYRSVMKDEDTKGIFHYNDCDHESVRCDYGVFVPFSLERAPYFTYITSQEPHSPRVKMPVGKIFYDMFYGGKTASRVAFPHKRVLNWLSDYQLPTTIIVDRDPFDSDFSIWFLVADIIQLPKLVSSIFARSIIRRHEFAGTRTFKQLADDDLLAKFGVLATYRDIVDFVGICRRFQRGFEEYVKSDKYYRWHGPDFNIRDAVPDPGPLVVQQWNALGTGNLAIARYTAVETCQHYRTMSYRLMCPELKSWLSRFMQLIELLGVLDPAGIWDAVPFTFVADWFFDIGPWLHRNRPRLFQGAIEVKDYCESIRLQYTQSYFACPALDLQVDDPGVELTDIGEETHRTYVRRRYQPEGGRIQLGTGHPLLSIRQAIIAAGLTAQRLPRPGNIGDIFEGIDFGQDPIPVNGTTAADEFNANQAWAQRMRDRKASTNKSGVYPELKKFERSKSDINRDRAEDMKKLQRLPRHGRRSQLDCVPMRKYRGVALRFR